MWQDKLKELGVNIHVVATGAGSGIQNTLWSVPGSSAYLGGAGFPYSSEEQEDLLGFMPDHFCNAEAAIDLASAAYMKAYKFGGKKAIGLGLAASVASEKIHRGDHRVFACIITDDKVISYEQTLEKGVGQEKRYMDGSLCDQLGIHMMTDALGIDEPSGLEYTNTTELARTRFFAHPFFTANGRRLFDLPKGKLSLMSGAFNPPHEGHFSIAQAVQDQYNYRTVFEITSEPPHKDALSVQSLLQRSQLLRGYDRLFTGKLPYYIDKARKYPGRPLTLGADAVVRMLDPKWGLDLGEMFDELYNLNTKFLVANREIDDRLTTCQDILDHLKDTLPFKHWAVAQIIMRPIKGDWNFSSTEIREKLAQSK